MQRESDRDDGGGAPDDASLVATATAGRLAAGSYGAYELRAIPSATERPIFAAISRSRSISPRHDGRRARRTAFRGGEPLEITAMPAVWHAAAAASLLVARGMTPSPVSPVSLPTRRQGRPSASGGGGRAHVCGPPRWRGVRASSASRSRPDVLLAGRRCPGLVMARGVHRAGALRGGRRTGGAAAVPRRGSAVAASSARPAAREGGAFAAALRWRWSVRRASSHPLTLPALRAAPSSSRPRVPRPPRRRRRAALPRLAPPPTRHSHRRRHRQWPGRPPRAPPPSPPPPTPPTPPRRAGAGRPHQRRRRSSSARCDAGGGTATATTPTRGVVVVRS